MDAEENRLLSVINQGSLKHIEAYSRLAGAQRIRDLPFVTKADLRARRGSFLSPAYSQEAGWVKNTTGTTGQPIPIVYSAEFYFELALLALWKIARRAGFLERFGERPIICLAINDKKADPGMVIAGPGDQAAPSLQVHVDERKPSSFQRVVEMVRDLKPLCIVSKPSLLEQFCGVLDYKPGLGEAAPVFVVSSGSALLAGVRSMLEECFAARVIDAYTMTEFGLIASECIAGHMHIDTTSVYAEVIDEGGHPLPRGEMGELVLTSLNNAAMPLVRYRTGDEGILNSGRCPCGSAGPRISRLGGKRIECFHLSDGSRFSPTFFNDLFARFPLLVDFQIAQTTAAHFAVTVELKPHIESDCAQRELEAIQCYIQDSLPGAPEVAIERGALQTNGKFRRYRTDL